MGLRGQASLDNDECKAPELKEHTSLWFLSFSLGIGSVCRFLSCCRHLLGPSRCSPCASSLALRCLPGDVRSGTHAQEEGRHSGWYRTPLLRFSLQAGTFRPTASLLQCCQSNCVLDGSFILFRPGTLHGDSPGSATHLDAEFLMLHLCFAFPQIDWAANIQKSWDFSEGAAGGLPWRAFHDPHLSSPPVEERSAVSCVTCHRRVQI